MVEQRHHELVGRPRVVSVSKVLVESDVYRSAARSAESRGERDGVRKGHRTVGVFVAGSVGRCIDGKSTNFERGNIRIVCIARGVIYPPLFRPKALVIVASSPLTTMRRLPAPAYMNKHVSAAGRALGDSFSLALSCFLSCSLLLHFVMCVVISCPFLLVALILTVFVFVLLQPFLS